MKLHSPGRLPLRELLRSTDKLQRKAGAPQGPPAFVRLKRRLISSPPTTGDDIVVPAEDLSFETLNAAWWDWVDKGCPSRAKRARGRWMHENTFTFDGTTWLRDRQTSKSNSGKTTYTDAETFIGGDGRVITRDFGKRLNRRNDPDRNWGLPD